MTIAVIGATGTIGPHIVRSLQARDATIRVITRDAQRARTLLPGSIEIREADITDHDSIIDAAAGASSLLLLTSHAHDMTDVQLRIIRALRRSGVRIVKISGTSSAINPDGPYTCRQHWEVEKILESSGQPFVVLRPNAFMQTLIGQILIPRSARNGSRRERTGDFRDQLHRCPGCGRVCRGGAALRRVGRPGPRPDRLPVGDVPGNCRCARPCRGIPCALQ